MAALDETLSSIQGLGHWDVSLHPAKYDAQLIDYAQLLPLVTQAEVRLRGLPLPSLGYQGVNYGQDWIGQDREIVGLTYSLWDAWRLFTSGQFLHLRTFRGDQTESQKGVDYAKIVSVVEIVYHLTEILEFASRLATAVFPGPKVVISAKMHNMKDRHLVSGAVNRDLHRDYVSSDPSIILSQEYDRDVLVSEPRAIAVSLSKNALLRFGFDANEQILSGFQGTISQL